MGNGFGCFLNIGSEVQVILFSSISVFNIIVNYDLFVFQVSVMIMSLKAASLGLNMVAACHVLMLDLWWNPTTEDQAIDRAHRIGQTRPVTVLRLTVRDTVEDRILALQVFSLGCLVNMFFFYKKIK